MGTVFCKKKKSFLTVYKRIDMIFTKKLKTNTKNNGCCTSDQHILLKHRVEVIKGKRLKIIKNEINILKLVLFLRYIR